MMDFQPLQPAPVASSPQMILCCQCGTSIPPNPANMCVQCIRTQVDITEGIPKQVTVHWCKNCERYLQPPTTWVVAALESKELLALLLRKLKVRLIDASFIWTEPHSKRLKMKLTIQKEVFAATILQQIFQIEAVVAGLQCNDCTRIMAQNTWKASVQARQKGVAHKKTFFYLEQLILKHQAHRDTINIKECKDGIDFYFAQRSHAIRMMSFLQSVVPMRSTSSEQLISSDVKAGTANFKFTYSADIAPICKDDLVVLPLKLAKQMGNISPLVICYRVSGSGMTMLDPRTMQLAEVQTTVYWRAPFVSLVEAGASGNASPLTEYYVLDVEPIGPTSGKFALADVTVCKCVRGNQEQRTDGEPEIDPSQTFITRSHLGNILNPGDYALGYDLHTSNLNSDLFEDLLRASQSGSAYAQIPDVVLLKKMYVGRRRASGKAKRFWRVKRLAADAEDGILGMDMDEDVKKQMNRRGERERRQHEWEGFMRELEEDKDLRGMVNLYRDPTVPVEQPAEGSGEFVDLAELLEDMAINEDAMPDGAAPEDDDMAMSQ